MKGFIKGFITMVVIFILIVSAIVLLFKMQIIKLPFTLGVRSTSYIAPAFSSEGEGFAYIQVDKERNRDQIQYITSLHSKDIKGKNRKKLSFITLGKFEELSINDLSIKKESISLQKVDYVGNSKVDYLCDFKTGQYKIEKQKNLYSDNQMEFIRPQSNDKITITNPDIKSNGNTGKVEYSKENGLNETIITTGRDDESFKSLGWVNNGNNFLFQFHTIRSFNFYNQLYSFTPNNSELLMIADDSFNVILSPDISLLAYLVPLCRTKSGGMKDLDACEQWQMKVRNLDIQKRNIVTQKNYDGDIELYSWIPDTQGFIFTRENVLFFYDALENTEKELVNSVEDGWWGYPLSPYYIAISKKGGKIALLTYSYSDSGKKDSSILTERVIIVDINKPEKKVIRSDFFSTGRIQFLFNYHPRIIWSNDDNLILYEGRNRKHPEITDIYLLTPDGSKKSNVSKNLPGIIDFLIR